MTGIIDNPQQALLQTIFDKPDDDVARLVYADWLEEHDQAERAKFIRLQVKQVQMLREETDCSQCTPCSCDWCPICGDCCCPNPEDRKDDPQCPLHNPSSMHAEYEELEDLERGMVDYLGIDFLLGITNYEWGYWLPKVEMGLISELSMDLEDWLGCGPAIMREHPIQRVQITDKEPWRFRPTMEGITFIQYSYRWHLQGVYRTDRANEIPSDIFSLLNESSDSIDFLDYDSSEVAHTDLSRTCIRLACHEAKVKT